MKSLFFSPWVVSMVVAEAVEESVQAKVPEMRCGGGGGGGGNQGGGGGGNGGNGGGGNGGGGGR